MTRLGGRDLAGRLSRLGYQIARQTGSHIRLTCTQSGEHHITMPEHKPLKPGTLAVILRNVARSITVHRGMSCFVCF